MEDVNKSKGNKICKISDTDVILVKARHFFHLILQSPYFIIFYYVTVCYNPLLMFKIE